MADVKVQAVVEASTEGVERAFDRVGDKAVQMASKVDQAAQKAGGSVDSIGKGAGGSADQFDRAHGKMAAAMKRTITQIEMVGKTASQKFEMKIAMQGLDAAKLEPMLAKMREVEAQQARIATGASGLTGKMSGLAVAVGAAGAAFAAWSSIRGVATAMIDAQQSAQKLRNSLEYAAGGATQAAFEISYLREVTNKLGLDFDSSSQAYAKFAAATKGSGVSLQQTKTVFEGIASASAKMGLSADETQGALLALSQMASKGTVSAEELRGQLGERLPGAFNIAAKSMGVTTAELGKLLETGQLMASDFLPKFGQALKDNFQAPLDSLTQELNRFSSAWTLWKQTLSDGANGSGFKWLTNGLNESTEAMRALGKEAGIVQRMLVAIGGFEMGAVGANKFDTAKVQEQELKNLEAIKARKARLEAAITSGSTTRSSSQAGFDALAKEERAIRERIINLAEQRGKKDGLNLPDLAGEYLAQQKKQTDKLNAYINDVSNAPKAAKVAAEVEKENTAFKAAVSGMAETDSRYISALKAHNDRVAEIQKPAKAAGGGTKNDATQQYAAALAAEKDYAAAQVKLIQNRVTAGVESEEDGIKKVLAAKVAGYDKEREILNAQLAKTTDRGDKTKIEQQIAAIGTASTVAASEADAAFAKIGQARDKYLQAQVTSANSIAYRIEDENAALREQIDVLGMSEQQIGEYEAAKINAAAGAEYLAAANLREAASSMEAAGVASDAIPYYRQLAEAREAAGNALSEKAALESTKGIKKSAIDAAKEWQKTSDKIGDSITDALMRGFESGKSFAETLRDTVVNMFKTMVLQPTIKAVVVGGLSAVGMGSATAADGSSTGGIGNMLSTGKSIYSTGSSVYDVGSQWLSGTMSGANAAGTLYANATGTGLDGLLATNGAYGTAAGTVAAADLGATIGTAAGTALAGSAAGTVFATTATGAAVSTTTAAGVAAASGTAAAGAGTAAMAAIPYVGVFTALAAAAYSAFGHKKTQDTGAVATSTNGGMGANVLIGRGTSADTYDAGIATGVASINKSYFDTLNPLLAALGNKQVFSITSDQSAKKKGNGNQYAGFDIGVDGQKSTLQYGYGKVSDAEALAKATSSALGEGISRAISLSDLSAPIKKLFEGVVDQAVVGTMVTGLTKVGNASKELDDVWGISVSQAAEVALLTGQTQEGVAKTVDAIGTFAAAQRTVGATLESAYASLDPVFTQLTNSPLPDNLAAYDAAMKNVDTTVAGGIETFAAMFAMREGFAQFRAAIDGLKTSASTAIDAFRTPEQRLTLKQSELSDLSAKAGIAVPTSGAELVAMFDSIDFTKPTEAGMNLASALPAIAAAFTEVQNAEKALGIGATAAASAMDELRTTLLEHFATAQTLDQSYAAVSTGLGMSIDSLKNMSADDLNQNMTDLITGADSAKLGIINGLLPALDMIGENATAVADAAKEAADAIAAVTQGLRDNAANLNVELLAAQGNTSGSLAAARDIAIAGMNAEQVALWDTNTATQALIASLNTQAEKTAAIASERKGLQDQLDDLTMTSTQLLLKQRDAMDESNRALFDSVEAAKRATAIASERKGLQEQLDSLTMNNAQLLNKQRDALDESNRGLFDQVEAIKAANAAMADLASQIESIGNLRTNVQSSKQGVISQMSTFDAVGYYGQQVKDYSGLFAKSTTTSDKLDYGSKWQSAIASGLDAQIAALGKTKDARIAALQAEADAINENAAKQKQAAQEMASALENIAQYAKNMLTGNLSTLSPEAKLAAASSEYNRLYKATKGGDATAAGQLTGASDTYLGLAKDYYASSSGYTSIFGTVQSQLSGLGSQASVYEQIANSTAGTYDLAKATAAAEAAYQAQVLALQQSAVAQYTVLEKALTDYQGTLELDLDNTVIELQTLGVKSDTIAERITSSQAAVTASVARVEAAQEKAAALLAQVAALLDRANTLAEKTANATSTTASTSTLAGAM